MGKNHPNTGATGTVIPETVDSPAVNRTIWIFPRAGFVPKSDYDVRISHYVDGYADNHHGNVTIACSTGQKANSGIQNLDRGLVRRLADTLLHFIGYRRAGEPFRNRNLD